MCALETAAPVRQLSPPQLSAPTPALFQKQEAMPYASQESISLLVAV